MTQDLRFQGHIQKFPPLGEGTVTLPVLNIFLVLSDAGNENRTRT